MQTTIVPGPACDKGVAEIIISKQRNGPIGTVRLDVAEQELHALRNAS